MKAQARCSVNHSILSSWSSNKSVSISLRTWHTKRLTTNSADLKYPEIEVSGNYVHVVFLEDATLCYKRSTDGGATWEARQNLSTSGHINPFPQSYAIEADGPYVHLVVDRSLPSSMFDIFYRRNTDYGASGSWGEWRQLTHGWGNFMYPDMVLDGQYVHIAYYGDWPGTYEVFYKRISNYGVGSTLTRRLTYTTSGSTHRACIGQSSQYVYVVYETGSYPNNQLFLKRISNDGSGSIYTKRLTYNSINSEHPDIVTSGEYIFVVYINYDSSCSNFDIFSKTIEIYGTGSTTTKRLTYAGRCLFPSIAFNTNTDTVEVAYNSNAPMNHEIFWKVVSNFGKGSFSTYRLTYSTSGTSKYPDIEV